MTIASVFDAVCFQFGDEDAILTSDNTAIGYSELQQASLALAWQLHHRYRPDYVMLDLRGCAVAEAVSVIACNRVGVPFVPVDAEGIHAGDRLRTIVSTLLKNKPNCQVVAVVRCNNDADPIVSLFAAADIHNVVYVNGNGDLLEPMDVPQTLPDTVISDDLYVLFTSGTSGNTPKAVVGSQSSTLHRLRWFAETFPPTQDTIIARRSKLTFVDSITELLSALLFPLSKLYAFDPDELASHGVELILDSPCTQVTMLPSQLEQLLLLPNNRNHSLETVIISGEPCKPSILAEFREHFPTTRLINLYGQTESTGDMLCAVLTDMKKPVVDSVVAVGTPIPGVYVSLTDDNELVVKGNLSNGYLHSNNAFTLFPAGDIGFCRDGVWYVQGRMDNMCKINGQLVSPTEVEAAFQTVFGIPCAASIVDTTIYALVETGSFIYKRETMRQASIPWHLIPRRVFCVSSIPKSGGAGKVDRSSVKRIIQELVVVSPTVNDADEVESILASILELPIEQDKSFVEMGGDSALAITLLYKLRVAGLCHADVTAADILESENVKDLRDVVSGVVKRKRRKVPVDTHDEEPFVARDITRFSDQHFAVEFKACVDAPPLVHGTDVYGACQGGVIQRIADGKVTACYQLSGWKIQAGMIVLADSLIVCGYDDEKDSGIAASLSLDLSSLNWSKHVSGLIKSTPIAVNDRLWVAAGALLIILDAEYGSQITSLQLPSRTESRPAVVVRNGNPCVVYAFADWDTGLAIVDCERTSVTTVCAGDVANPVYANLLALDATNVVVCDISGVLHEVNDESIDVKSTKISSKPIFSGSVLVDDTIVFGSHDGIVRCFQSNDLRKELWNFDAGGVVYSSPLPVPMHNGFVVCTTAGDVILVREGRELARTKVPGEIWSDPVLIGMEGDIAVGARGSRIHFMKQR